MLPKYQLRLRLCIDLKTLTSTTINYPTIDKVGCFIRNAFMFRFILYNHIHVIKCTRNCFTTSEQWRRSHVQKNIHHQKKKKGLCPSPMLFVVTEHRNLRSSHLTYINQTSLKFTQLFWIIATNFSQWATVQRKLVPSAAASVLSVQNTEIFLILYFD